MRNFICILIVLLNTIPVFSQRASPCNCWISRDSTWTIAAFDGTGGSGGPGLPPEYRNDDWSTIAINIPFHFCFYGDTITSFIINNNGNISFGSAYSTFTANSFPDPNFKMIAPFWADVDTRDTLSGIVYYKIFSNYIVYQWDHVGYFSYHDSLLNTFQLIISDGNPSPLPETKNVGFCYKDMQWTTGDASQGLNGFGGAPATVGVNYGNGINYLQIGLYDNASLNYDGPYGINDGVASLSNQSFAFNVCVNNFNVPPILSGAYICDTIELCTGDSFSYAAQFISPEMGQLTTVNVNDHGMGGVNVVTNPGNNASVAISFLAGAAGNYMVDITGTDDGNPAAHTTYSLILNIQNCGVGINDNPTVASFVSPNPVRDELRLSLIDNENDISISDISGRIIYKSRISNNAVINSSEWRKGIYFINVKSEKGTNCFKIIKD